MTRTLCSSMADILLPTTPSPPSIVSDGDGGGTEILSFRERDPNIQGISGGGKEEDLFNRNKSCDWTGLLQQLFLS